MIEPAFLVLVTSDASVTALVGNRVYPIILPQSFTRPALTYQVVSAPRNYNQDGVTGLVPYSIQVDLWGDTYLQVATLRDALANLFNGVLNDSHGSPAVLFNAAFITNERDLYETALDASGPTLYRKSLDVEVWAHV